MTYEFAVNQHLDTVRVADLRSYLLGRGWKRTSFPQKEVIRFEGPLDDEGRPLIQFVPATETLRDFSLRVEEIVGALSRIENRSAGEILRDILTPNCDKLTIRLESSETRAGTLKLGFATRFIESVRNLLVFGACAELDPRPYLPRALKDAVNYANHCFLAGAPTGSFAVEVQSPLDRPASQNQIAFGSVPWERRVLQRLMRGLDDVRSAVDYGETASLLGSRPWRLNANVCDALLGMNPDTPDVMLEVRAAWSESWPTSDEPTPGRVTFDARSFETVRSLGRALRDEGERRPHEWRGRIIRLAAEHPARDNGGQFLAVMRLENSTAPLIVELRLNAARYRIAAEAHLSEATVVVSGILERTTRKAKLLEISDFRVEGKPDRR